MGDVPSDTVVELQRPGLRRSVAPGHDGTNVVDDEHYEIFGGDILQRRFRYVTWSF